MTIPNFILNHRAVVDRFGRWPSFHDANVLGYEPPTPDDSSLGLTVHAWNMTNEVDEKGYFVLRDHSLVSFRFRGLSDLNMDSFRIGNILFALEFVADEGTPAFRVDLDSVMDMSGSFTAMVGEVISVIPCGSDGKPV